MNKKTTDNFMAKIISNIFEPLDNINPDTLFLYAEEMGKNAQDNIELGIAQTIMRFARFYQMSIAINKEKDNES